MKEPSRAFRLWVMVLIGTAFIILGLAEIIRAWVAGARAPQDLEISLALIGVGLVMLFFGTPDQGNAASLLAPGAKPPASESPANYPDGEAEGNSPDTSYRV